MKSLCLGKWGILSVISLVSTLTCFVNKHVYLQGHVSVRSVQNTDCAGRVRLRCFRFARIFENHFVKE